MARKQQKKRLRICSKISAKRIDMATQMIAKLLIIKALQAITGMIGGGGGTSSLMGPPLIGLSQTLELLKVGVEFWLANGGVIPPNSLGLVGERVWVCYWIATNQWGEQSQAAMAR